MRRTIEKSLRILLFCLPAAAFGQKAISFEVEKLSRPERLLEMYKDVPERLVLSEIDITPKVKEQHYPDFSTGIVAASALPDSLVYLGNHAFFNGMYRAYADHRPYVLSPDMIWLLIGQGFARHIQANPEILRKNFDGFEGRKLLLVPSFTIDPDNPESNWEEVFPIFTEQIAANGGEEIVRLLSADFSTTTPVEKAAFEITAMGTTKPYFEFVVFKIICGIPRITLQGTPEDWQQVLDKTRELSRYDLKWWTAELEPVLEEFVKTSQGKIDTAFWRNMFKYHAPKQCGNPAVIDGWIVRFFPYDKDGRRNDLKQSTGADRLPDEIVKAEVTFFDEKTEVETPLEFWAGFFGLDQNCQDFALTPRIGWMIRKKDVDQAGLSRKLEIMKEKQQVYDSLMREIYKDNESALEEALVFGDELYIRVSEMPPAILEQKKVKRLRIIFTGPIVIPDRMATMKIEELILSGETNEAEIKRISKMFPHTALTINGKIIEKP